MYKDVVNVDEKPRADIRGEVFLGQVVMYGLLCLMYPVTLDVFHRLSLCFRYQFKYRYKSEHTA